MYKPVCKVLYVIIGVVLGMVWLMQASLADYWQETRHEPFPLDRWQSVGWWHAGAQLQQAWMVHQDGWAADVAQFDARVVRLVNAIWFEPPAALPVARPASTPPAPPPALVLPPPPPPPPVELAALPPPAPPAVPESAPAPDIPPLPATPRDAPPVAHPAPGPAPQTVPSPPTPEPSATTPAFGPLAPGPIPLKKGDRVLFVGDSLMQGVAPYVRKALYHEYGIEGTDLSKQSTGLAYTHFFDWPKTVEQTFDARPDIRLMVVFLGPNDPWDMPVQKGKPYAKFKSPEWEAVYRARIRAILQSARDHEVHVLWLEVPTMRKKKLEGGMEYLNGLYADEVREAGERLIATRALLGDDGGGYTAYAPIDGKETRVRVDDGIHFTTRGQVLLAHAILDQIQGTPAHVQ